MSARGRASGQVRQQASENEGGWRDGNGINR